MWLRRFLSLLLLMGLSGAILAPAGANHDEEYPYNDTWNYAQHDCENDSWNPLDEDGNRTGTDPEPGSAAWAARSQNQTACSEQRQTDNSHQPIPRYLSSARYGEDPYRWPDRHNNVRFRFTHFNRLEIPGVSSAEMYRPCSNALGDCPNLPAGLERFDPPYPVVIVMHGVIAQDSHHRFNTQVFAEKGYMAIGVDGTGAGYAWLGSGPNSQNCDNPDSVFNWLASSDSGVFGQEVDLGRIAVAGHSQGSGCALQYQGGPGALAERTQVDAIIAWDGGDSISASNCVAPDFRCTPIMYQRTDGDFSDPTSHSGGYPDGRNRGLPTYNSHKERGLDVFHLTARSTEHVDWNGRGTQLNGNRLFEDFSNYYNVAWLDRHLKGKLVLTGNETPAEEAAERSSRQALAEDAYSRLIAKKFSGTNVHNISMGFWSPQKAEASGDSIFGGNVPYHIDGKWTMNRFSWFFRSFCSVSVPDYVNGSSGAPGSPVAARADSGEDGDVRLNGCPQINP